MKEPRVIIARSLHGEKQMAGWRILQCAFCGHAVQVSPTVAAVNADDKIVCNPCGLSALSVLRPEQVAYVEYGPACGQPTTPAARMLVALAERLKQP